MVPTEANIQTSAEKIYDALNSDSKMSDLIKAKIIPKVSYKGDKSGLSTLMFTKEKESSSSSTEKSSESKASSSDEFSNRNT